MLIDSSRNLQWSLKFTVHDAQNTFEKKTINVANYKLRLSQVFVDNIKVQL